MVGTLSRQIPLVRQRGRYRVQKADDDGFPDKLRTRDTGSLVMT